jgi:hypothetical protein
VKEVAYASARELKSGICKNDIVEIVDRSTRVKVVMFADGRTG